MRGRRRLSGLMLIVLACAHLISCKMSYAHRTTEGYTYRGRALAQLSDIGRRPRLQIPDSGTRFNSTPGIGLPENDCITFSERYAGVQHPSVRSSIAANGLHPHSKFVVLMKLHMTHEEETPVDLWTYLRSVGEEVTAAGYHYFILLQIANNRDDQHKLTREEMLEFLPADLRPFVIMHDTLAILDHYSKIRDDETGDWGPGPKAGYLGVVHFFQEYEAYKYAWIIEYDVRWTGRNIAHHFNAALSLAQQATEEELTLSEQRLIRTDRTSSRAMPSSYEGLPDFLTFGWISKSDKWKDAWHNMDHVSESVEHWAIVYFGSRNLFEALHRWSLEGRGTHIEGLLGTVARTEGLKAAAIPMPEHPDVGHGYYHCCTPDARDLYSGWYNDTGSCLPGYLLHPVKLTGAWWPKVANAATAHQHLSRSQISKRR